MDNKKPVFALFYGGCVFKVNKGVFPPYYGSFLLERSAEVKKDDDVLDVGTGTGFFALLAFKKGARRVIATDVVRESAECAKQNVILNGAGNAIKVVSGNLFSAVKGKKFDAIFANVPILPSPCRQKDLMSIGRDGGKDGKEVLYKLLKQTPRFLKNKGRIYFTHFDFTDVHATMTKMKQWGLKAVILAEEECPLSEVALERLDYLYSLMRPSPIRKKGNRFVCKRYAVCGIKQ